MAVKYELIYIGHQPTQLKDMNILSMAFEGDSELLILFNFLTLGEISTIDMFVIRLTDGL